MHSFYLTKQTISETKSTRNVFRNLLGGVGTLIAPVLLKVSSGSETASASPVNGDARIALGQLGRRGKGEGKGDDGDGGRAGPSQVRPVT